MSMRGASIGAVTAVRRALMGPGRRGPMAVAGILPALADGSAMSRFPCDAGSRRGARWSIEREPHPEILPANQIVREDEIHEMLAATQEAAKDKARVKEILQLAKDRALLKKVPKRLGSWNGGATNGLASGCGVAAAVAGDEDAGADAPKSEYVQGLTLEEAATLINVDSSDEDLMRELFDTALFIKERIYGNRIVLFAPLYLSNYCVNSCTYCAYRGANKGIERAKVTDHELRLEVEALQRQGHRRLLLLTGEHPKYSFDDFLHALEVVSKVRTPPHGAIRRINVEIPALSVSDMRRLKATDVVGTYTLFQETYNREAFKKFHPFGPKSDYENRVQVMDRAQIAGIDDVGIGALFGLYDYRFEVLGLLQHGMHLENVYGAGPHTISIPRIRPADSAPDAMAPPHPVSDDDFKKLAAVLRCAVPYTGMILSTRESVEMRQSLLHLGVSQMSAGSRTDVEGSYHKGDIDAEVNSSPETLNTHGQFTLQDHRSLDAVVKDLMQHGFVPSWCTACYRNGRTGEAFMKIAKSGHIGDFCHPNSLITLQEYMDDYATPATRAVGEEVQKRERATFTRPGVVRALDRKMKRIKLGERDLYF